ncbi:hypothetical protein [Halomonas sp. M4R1S46]|uniref:hypothetical protein n=1 Tax=Halomonas sp. M4R1S46 TaxID=2982692 RepID=UPI0021E35C0B|nr:hypothetical protein [Halomonas sp. M4R1S46]UYG06773.1 hypothetical protein OCT48_14240 [Halomonas sp. M4R1S46]
MADKHSTNDHAEIRADLLGTLKGYVDRYQRQHGFRPPTVAIGRAEWSLLGCPDMAAGVRILPTGDETRLVFASAD